MRYRYQNRGRVYDLSIERQGDVYQVTVDGQTYPFEVLDAQPGQTSLRIGDRPVTVYHAQDGPDQWISVSGCTFRLEKPAPRQARAAGEMGGGQSVRAPMPAQVRAVQVSEGDSVEKGQTLLLLEAMKMEIRVKASASGTIKRITASTGQTVEKDQLLVEIQ